MYKAILILLYSRYILAGTGYFSTVEYFCMIALRYNIRRCKFLVIVWVKIEKQWSVVEGVSVSGPDTLLVSYACGPLKPFDFFGSFLCKRQPLFKICDIS